MSPLAAIPIIVPIVVMVALVVATRHAGGDGSGGSGGASSPARAKGGPLHVVVIGDFGIGGAVEQQLGNAVQADARRDGLDLLVTVGDNNYASTEHSWESNWNTAFGWLQAGVTVAGTLGNHDPDVRAGGGYEFDELGMPADHYTRRLRDVELFILNSNRVDSTQAAWLDRSLSASDARWKIVVFHHPPYTCGVYRHHRPTLLWVPVLERHHVPLVLNGHDHNYQRFRIHGTTYVVDGGAGADLDQVAECPQGNPEPLASEDDEHSVLELTVSQDTLTGSAETFDGRVIDRFSVH